jgi:hypothetical protein
LTPPGLAIDAIKYLQNAYTSQSQVIHTKHAYINDIIEVDAELNERQIGEERQFSHHAHRDFAVAVFDCG